MSMPQLLTAALNRVQASLDREIRTWFADHPNPSDPDVHEFAGQLGIAPETLEAHIYRMFTKCNDRTDRTDRTT